MGQKTHPYGFRLGYNKPWKSRWYAGRDYAELLHEDVKLRKELKEKLKSAASASIENRTWPTNWWFAFSPPAPGSSSAARRGNRQAQAGLQKRTKREVHIDIQEVASPDWMPPWSRNSIALQLEKRVAFARIRKSVDSALHLAARESKYALPAV